MKWWFERWLNGDTKVDNYSQEEILYDPRL